jgi:hypothetical protein
VGAPARGDRLETSTFAFATDLADEGVEPVLRNVQERGGLSGITPAFVYHAARDVFPHNPRRKVQLLDRGEFWFCASSRTSPPSRPSATSSRRPAARRRGGGWA